MTLVSGQAKTDGPALLDSPQGKHVQAWLTAFNSGDEKTFLKAQEELFAPATLAKRTPEERANMFRRLHGDFGTMKVEKVLSATPQEIRILVPTADGGEGTFTFTFDAKAPFRITGLGVEVQGGLDLPQARPRQP